MSIEQKLCKVKIFQLLSMSKAITWIDKRFAVKNVSLSCPALIFNSRNPTMTILHAKNQVKPSRFLFVTIHIPFSSVELYIVMA